MDEDEDADLPFVTWALAAGIVAYALLVTGFLPTDESIASSLWSRAALEDGDWVRMFASMFAHGGPLHLAFNVLGLLSLGAFLEPAIGHARFTVLYFASGIGGNLLHAAMSDVPAVGASGAIFGLVGLLLMLAPALELSVFFFPMPAAIACTLYLAVVLLVPAFSDLPVAHYGHLGGMFVGVGLAFEANGRRALRNTPYVVFVAACAFAIVAWFRGTDLDALGDAFRGADWGRLAEMLWFPLLALVAMGAAIAAVERRDKDDAGVTKASRP